MKQTIIIMKNGQNVAKYIDIELNGYAFIAVVENNIAQKILNTQDSTIHIKGRLIKLEETSMADGLEKIKQNYLEDLGMEMTEEEILEMFTPLQLLNYGEEKPNAFLVVILIMALIIVLLYCIILIKNTIKKQKQIEQKKKKKESSFKNV